MTASALAHARASLRAGLEARRPELEREILNRVFAIADPSDADPVYREGLRASVSIAIDYALEALQRGEDRVPPPPPQLLVQARMAARGGIDLGTVLRRYLAGYSLLGEFLMTETASYDIVPYVALQSVLRGQAATLDRLLRCVADEYGRELASRSGSTQQRRLEQIRKLLAGELIDPAELVYDFEAEHVGVVGVGQEAAPVLRSASEALDARLLLVEPDATTAWAWLCSRRRLDPCEVSATLLAIESESTCFAIGESMKGLAGWRSSHRQAVAALPAAARSGERVSRYVDVALLASVMQDDLAVASLRQIYLAPLEMERDGGAALRETLSVYLALNRNVSSTATALKVSRNTVSGRLAAIEERIGRQIDSCAADLRVALSLDELEEPVHVSSVPSVSIAAIGTGA